MECQSSSVLGENFTHHSDDIVEIWTGKPEPVYLCGFHAQFL